MAADFILQAHDLLPVIQGAAANAGKPVDLSAALSAKFIMRAADTNFQPITTGQPKVNSTAVIVTPASGVIAYNWAASDTDTPGNYVGQFQVNWSGSRPQTFPTTTYITIQILADLDGA